MSTTSTSRAQLITAVATAFVGVLLFILWYGGDLIGLVRRLSSQELPHFLIALAVAAFISVLCHLWIRRWLHASIVSALVLDFVVTLLTVSGGEPSGPFFLIALLTVTLFGFAVASVVGVLCLSFSRCSRSTRNT